MSSIARLHWMMFWCCMFTVSSIQLIFMGFGFAVFSWLISIFWIFRNYGELVKDLDDEVP